MEPRSYQYARDRLSKRSSDLGREEGRNVGSTLMGDPPSGTHFLNTTYKKMELNHNARYTGAMFVGDGIK